MNAVHLGYGIGAVLVNLVARPFLTSRTPSGSDVKIIPPYCITGALCIVVAIGNLICHILEARSSRETVEVRQVRRQTTVIFRFVRD